MAGLADMLFPQPNPTLGGGAPMMDPRQAMWQQFAANMGSIVGRRPTDVQPLYGAYQKQQELNNLAQIREMNNRLREEQLRAAKQQRERETQRLADLAQVTGTPGEMMGPPTAAGEMQEQGGVAPSMSLQEYLLRNNPEKYLELQMQDNSTSALKKYREMLALGADEQTAFQNAFGQQQGPSLVVGPDGRIAFNASGQAQLPPLPLGTAATNQVQKDVLDKTNTLARLNEIDALYNPEFQELGTRLENTWLNAKDWVGMANPKDQQKLADWHRFRTAASSSLMKVLHDMGGSALTAQEIERISATMPNPGVNFWQGDKPTEFQSKLRQVQADIKRALFRAEIAQQEGVGWGSIPLNDTALKAKIEDIGQRFVEGYIGQGMTPEAADQAALMRLKALYGEFLK